MAKFNEHFALEAESEIARHTASMSKFVESKDFESAHAEAVIIISAFRTLTDQLLIHVRKD